MSQLAAILNPVVHVQPENEHKPNGETSSPIPPRQETSVDESNGPSRNEDLLDLDMFEKEEYASLFSNDDSYQVNDLQSMDLSQAAAALEPMIGSKCRCCGHVYVQPGNEHMETSFDESNGTSTKEQLLDLDLFEKKEVPPEVQVRILSTHMSATWPVLDELDNTKLEEVVQDGLLKRITKSGFGDNVSQQLNASALSALLQSVRVRMELRRVVEARCASTWAVNHTYANPPQRLMHLELNLVTIMDAELKLGDKFFTQDLIQLLDRLPYLQTVRVNATLKMGRNGGTAQEFHDEVSKMLDVLNVYGSQVTPKSKLKKAIRVSVCVRHERHPDTEVDKYYDPMEVGSEGGKTAMEAAKEIAGMEPDRRQRGTQTS
ncbi:hypothetical protein LTR37_017216 [Vermiconidia calcicola]|uniref:Uncharacterized protein n=1 Tax=Vermiconidia calcicola TaxID=1690605 RepID=A0ACC3MKN1_9PEZI|nr:hypothetical protein LTR37_017216 [Vermiconidia calcicola]